jgi:hypothetical protein
MKEYMDFRDVVHATQSQMLKQFGGECIPDALSVQEHLLLIKLSPLQMDSRDESKSFYLYF